MLRGYVANRHADNCTTQVLMDIDGARGEEEEVVGYEEERRFSLCRKGRGGAAIRSTALRKKEGGSGAGLGSGA